MKRNSISRSAALALSTLLAFTGCSDNNGNGIQPVNEEGNGSLTFSFKTTELTPVTKALTTTASEPEKTVKSVTAFVYDDKGLEQVKTFKDGDFTLTDDVFTLNKGYAIDKVKTNSDIKLYLGINLPDELTKQIVEKEGMGMNEDQLYDATLSQLTSNGYAMFSEAPATIAKGSFDENTHVKTIEDPIIVVRMVAKLSVTQKDGSNLEDVAGGKLSNLQYEPYNMSTSMYLLSAQPLATPKFDSNSFAYFQKLAVAPSDQIDKAPAYITENKPALTNGLPNNNNTYVLIEGLFTPEKLIGEDGNNIDVKDRGDDHAFKAVKLDNGNILYFKALTSKDPTDATGVVDSEEKPVDTSNDFIIKYIKEKYKSEITADKIIKYGDGKCYYAIDINTEENDYSVIRNHYYTFEISAINGLGYPVQAVTGSKPIDGSPEVPPAIDHSKNGIITISKIDVKEWEPKDVTDNQLN